MRRFVLLSLLLAATPAFAQSYGKTYTVEQIYGLSVQSFKLGISQDEATAILKRDHWEGDWHPFVSPDFEYPFKKGNSKLYLMRFHHTDGKLHIWSIVDRQTLNRPDYGTMANRAISDIWADTVVGNFGEASMVFSNPNGINAYVYYLMKGYRTDMPKLEAYLNGFETSYELSDRTLLNPEERNALKW